MSVLLAERALSTATNVLIFAERPTTRVILTKRLAAAPGRESRCVTTIGELIEQYSRHPGDLVLVGVHRGQPAGTEPISQLLRVFPAAMVVAFGSVEDTRELTAAVAAGARGLLLSTEEERVSTPNSSSPFPLSGNGSEVTQLNGPRGRAHTPTERELQVLRGMSQGRSNGEIGKDLFLSEDTVKTHARRLFKKLGANDRAHAVALGFRNGLVA
jgi:DNA-binding NarL/FixJ family response regulator